MSETMAYVASCPKCKHAVVVMVDTPRPQRENAKEVAKCIREGYVIERISVEDFRKRPMLCSCKKAKGAKAMQTELQRPS